MFINFIKDIFLRHKHKIYVNSLFAPEDKIIHAGIVNNLVPECIQKSQGFDKYMALATKPIRDSGASREYYTYQTSSYKSVYRNNADVIILSKHTIGLAWFPHRFQHTKTTLIEIKKYNPLFWMALLGIVRGEILKKWKVSGQVLFISDKYSEKYLVLSVTQRIPLGVRQYASPEIGASNFFINLRKANISYVLLRWFDSPEVRDPEEDFDVLVADKDYLLVLNMFADKPGIVPFDIYTETGIGSTGYNKVPYYPPHCAEKILSDTVLKEPYNIPSKKNYFLSLAYHAVFHKGYKSGVYSKYYTNSNEKFEHDYVDILKKSAKENNISIDMTLETLADYLQEVGWEPSKDMLRKMSPGNEWINDHYKSKLIGENESSLKPGLVMFIVRDAALKHEKLDLIKKLITDEGFLIINSDFLNEEQKILATKNIRGGNWGRGPWRTSGGDPAVCITAYDVIPKELSDYQKISYPHTDNSRILVKERIREAVNRDLSDEDRCNMLHTSDNTFEALEYVSLIFPEQLDHVLEQIKECEDSFKTKFPVVRSVTGGGRRAVIEIVEYKGGHAICKKFRSGSAMRYFNREKYVLENLSKSCKYIPPLLEAGDNYLVMPLYTHPVKLSWGLLPLPTVHSSMDFMRFLYDKGYFWGDSSPQNLCLDKETGQIKIIDFEFTQKYISKPNSFEESFDLVQSPSDGLYDFPGLRLRVEGDGYKDMWQPYTGLSLSDVLTFPVWKQHLKRSFFRISILPFNYVSSKLKTHTLSMALQKQLPSAGKRIFKSVDSFVDTFYR